MGKDTVEWMIKNRGLGWRVTRILLKEENSNQKLKSIYFSVRIGRRGEQTIVKLKCVTDGGQVAKLSFAWRFKKSKTSRKN